MCAGAQWRRLISFQFRSTEIILILLYHLWGCLTNCISIYTEEHFYRSQSQISQIVISFFSIFIQLLLLCSPNLFFNCSQRCFQWFTYLYSFNMVRDQKGNVRRASHCAKELHTNDLKLQHPKYNFNVSWSRCSVRVFKAQAVELPRQIRAKYTCIVSR